MKKAFPVLALVILMGLVSFQTLAYFTTSVSAENEITTGYLEMSLTDEDGAEVSLVGTSGVMPGDSYEQELYVTNTGTEDFYARVYLGSSITKGEDEEEMANPLQFTLAEGSKWVAESGLENAGWYYYTDIVPVGGVTEALIVEILFPGEDMGNEYIGASIELSTWGQSVQSANNTYDSASGETILDVEGWPAATVDTDQTVTGGDA